MSHHSLIFAIEEPESHLHPTAIHRLRDILLDIAKDHQVIITTHSPILVDREQVKRNILVRSGKAIPAKNTRELRDALGVRISDNLTTADLVLLLEGEHDLLLLKTWLSESSSKLRTAIANGQLALDSLNGAGNLSFKLGVFRTLLCDVFAFLDNDLAGRRSIDLASDSHLIDNNQYLFSTCPGKENSELEDLILEDCYFQAVAQEFGVTLVSRFMSSNKKAWSDRVAANFSSLGKPWSEKLETQVKSVVASSAASRGLASLNPHHRAVIDNLVTQIEARL